MDAKVKFYQADGYTEAAPGEEVTFSFDCPKYHRRCGSNLIAGRSKHPRDGQNKNGGVAQWDWMNAPNRDKPTFSPSINCGKCWHGCIRNGRTVDCGAKDEPERISK